MGLTTKAILRLTVSILVVLLFNHFACGVARAGLKGACAKVNITPPLGIMLIGSQGKAVPSPSWAPFWRKARAKS
jgi:hypothetical protein